MKFPLREHLAARYLPHIVLDLCSNSIHNNDNKGYSHNRNKDNMHNKGYSMTIHDNKARSNKTKNTSVDIDDVSTKGDNNSRSSDNYNHGKNHATHSHIH